MLDWIIANIGTIIVSLILLAALTAVACVRSSAMRRGIISPERFNGTSKSAM